MTPWVMRLVFANVVVFFLQQSQPAITQQFALIPGMMLREPWTAVTYMFLHGGFTHILFNMLVLWWFGPPVEGRLGGNKFLMLYFISGLAGALLSLSNPRVPIIGASAATYGVTLAFAWFWPRQQILMFGVAPIEARYLIVLYTVMSFIGMTGAQPGIAHMAHLGGFIGAWLYLKFLGEQVARSQKAWKDKLVPKVASAEPALERWKKINPQTLHPVNREEYDRVMAKVSSGGADSLTSSEREFMDRFSQVH